MDELAAEVRELTDGKGVPVVFDGVGAASWEASLASIARRGLIVTYGNASGPVPPFTALDLLRAGSIFVTRPTLADYCATARRDARLGRAAVRDDREGRGPVRIGCPLPARRSRRRPPRDRNRAPRPVRRSLIP